MALTTRLATLVGAALALGGAIGTAGTLVVANRTGVHESITLNAGDTVSVRFSIKTDTVLTVLPGDKVLAKRCGASHVFLRLYNMKVQQISADTVDVTVVCPDTAVQTITLFNRFADSAGTIVGVWDPTMVVGERRCTFVVARTATGRAVTGKPVTLSSSNTAVATVGDTGTYTMPPGMLAPSACPDTTVDPAAVVWQLRPAPLQG